METVDFWFVVVPEGSELLIGAVLVVAALAALVMWRRRRARRSD
jgi:MYXO-CTERM domain-containing protein